MSLITITQSMGCPGDKIAELVAESLHLELFDDATLQRTVQSMGRDLADLKHFNEKAPGFFDRLISNKPDIFLDLMEAVIYEVAKKGAGSKKSSGRLTASMKFAVKFPSGLPC